jgi:hypothetical protein
MKGFQQEKSEHDKDYTTLKSELRKNEEKNQPIVYCEKEEDEENFDNSAHMINMEIKQMEMELDNHQINYDEISHNNKDMSRKEAKEQPEQNEPENFHSLNQEKVDDKFSDSQNLKKTVDNQEMYLKESEKVNDGQNTIKDSSQLQENKTHDSPVNVSQNKITIKNESIIKDPSENYQEEYLGEGKSSSNKIQENLNEVENNQPHKEKNNNQDEQDFNEGENPIIAKDK